MSNFLARIIAELDTSKVEKQLNDLKDKKIKFDVNTGKAEQEIKQVDKNITSVDNSTKHATKSTRKFGDTLKNSFRFGSAYSIVSKGFQIIRNTANKAIEAIKDFDSAIKNLRMATGGSYSEVSGLVKDYNNYGKRLGATTQEVADSADSWLRQGHLINDTNTLIRDSMILSKVANMESADAAEYLTSAMKGYEVEATNVLGIVDKLTAVDMVSATDAGGLAEAMSKTAKSADLAGVSMDRLLGYLAATGEVTQESMSVIGTAFKTFFARYSGVKAGKLELVDEDGTVEILSDVEQSLKNVGIDIRKTITNFDGADEALDSLAAKWDELNGIQKNAIASAFGGTRQKERFLVLIENYDKAMSYMNTSMNSAGTAEKKFEVYLDSLEAKTKTLQASFESLAVNSNLGQVYKDVLDIANSIVSFLDKTDLLKTTLIGFASMGAIKGFTMFTTSVSNAKMRLNEFNSSLQLVKKSYLSNSDVLSLSKMTENLSKNQLKAVLSSKNLSDNQRIMILTNQGLSKAEAKTTLSTMGLATAQKTTATATNTLSGSLKGLWATIKANPLLFIVTTLTGLTQLIKNNLTYDAQLEKLKEYAQELSDVKSEIESLNSELSTAEERLNELESKGNLSFVEEEELNKLRQTNAELKSQLANLEALEKIKNKDVLDGFVSTINTGEFSDIFDGAYTDDLNRLTALREAAYKYEQVLKTKPVDTDNLTILENQKAIDDARRNYEVLLNQYNSGHYGYTFDTGKTSSMWQNDIDSMIDSYIDDYEKLQEAIDALEGIDYSLLNAEQKEAYRLAREKQWTIALEYSDEFGGLENVYQMIYNDKMFSEARDQIDLLINEDELTVESLEELIAENEQVNDLLAQLGINFSKEGLGGFISWFSKSDNLENNLVSQVEQAKKEFEGLKNELSELQSAYDTVQSAIKDYNDNGYMSFDSYQKMLELGDGYLALLMDENGQLNLNEEAYKRVMQAKLQELTLNRVSTLLENILAMSKEEAQAYANAEANYAEADSLTELVQAKYRLALAEAKTIDAKSGDTTYQDAINRSIGETNAWLSMMDSAIDGLGQYETVSNSASNATSNLTDELREQKEALEEAKSDIQDLIDLVIDMIKQEKESEKEVFEEKKDHINELIEKQKELLQAKKDEADFDRELADKQNIVAKNTLASSIAELDDSSVGKKYQKEVNDELSDSRNELNEFLSDKEYDTRIEALDKQQEANGEHYDNLIKSIDDYLGDERRLYEDACREIDDDNGDLYDKLYKYVYKYTDMSKGEFDGLWSDAQRALQIYDNAHTPLFLTMSNLDLAIHETSNEISRVSDAVSEKLSSSINIAKGRLKEYIDMLNNVPTGRWQIDYKGSTYWSYATDDDDAVVEIVEAIGYKDISEKHRLYQGVRQNMYRWTPPAYAQGTTSATGGISMVGENGAELRILNQGDGIIPAEITRNLMNMGVNPTEFFNKLAKENLWSTSSSDNVFDKILQDVSVEMKPNITVNSTVHIAGDATQSTVNALKKETENIANLAAKKVMNTALQYSNVPRKY